MFFVTSSGSTTKMDAVLSSAGETILHTTTEFRFTSSVQMENSEQAAQPWRADGATHLGYDKCLQYQYFYSFWILFKILKPNLYQFNVN